MKEDILLGIMFASLAAVMLACAHRINLDKKTIDHQAVVISGQQSVIDGNEATIAAYKENLTSCLKDSKVATQDEFTGE